MQERERERENLCIVSIMVRVVGRMRIGKAIGKAAPGFPARRDLPRASDSAWKARCRKSAPRGTRAGFGAARVPLILLCCVSREGREDRLTCGRLSRVFLSELNRSDVSSGYNAPRSHLHLNVRLLRYRCDLCILTSAARARVKFTSLPAGVSPPPSPRSLSLSLSLSLGFSRFSLCFFFKLLLTTQRLP